MKPALKLDFPMRDVVDHHVDRPDVEVQQCMQLTGTNIPIDLSYFDLRIVVLDRFFDHLICSTKQNFD